MQKSNILEFPNNFSLDIDLNASITGITKSSENEYIKVIMKTQEI